MKNFITLLTLSGLMFLLSACAKQNWYEGMQESHRVRCMNEPISTYEECMQEADENYSDYERERQSLSTEKKE